MALRRVCVFLGSHPGHDPAFRTVASDLGTQIARRGLGLVYGGGSVGLMGVLADAVLAGGGEVIGVIPEALYRREVGHSQVTQLDVVATMHERKARMMEASDGFLVLPGGIGTLEEFFEVFTWAALGFHARPITILDVGGYYEPLASLLDHAVTQGFLSPAKRALVGWATTPAVALDQLSD